MTVRSGLAAQLGIEAEATYGTYAVPTRFLEFRSEALSLTSERIESEALRAGTTILRHERWAENRKGVEGAVEFEVASKGFGLPLEHALGALAISTPGAATITRDHTITLGDLFGKSMTVQVGRPDVAGTVQPFSYLGAKVTDWELSNAVDEALRLTLTFDAQDETTTETLAVASFPADDELLYYTGCIIEIGGVAYDASSFTLTGNNGLKVDRHFLRSSSLKKEPILNTWKTITGSLEAEFDGLEAYDRFRNGELASITATWEGSEIEAGFNYGLEITMPEVRWDGTTPNVGGPDVVPQSLPFKVLSGDAEPITMRYRTTDIAA